jgi:hypothetical protein
LNEYIEELEIPKTGDGETLGKVGIMTYNTAACFDEFTMHPILPTGP